MRDWYTPDELRDLAGCRRRRELVEWLKSARIPFLLDADGEPKVLRATVAAILGPAANSTGPTLRLGAK